MNDLGSFSRRWLRHLGVLLIVFVSSAGMYLALHEDLRNELPPDSRIFRVSAFLAAMEERFLDFRLYRRMDSIRRDPDIVMLLIDDLSIKELGRFPWSRNIWASALDRLRELGARVVAFDIIFSEAERYCEGVSPDDAFVDSIKRFKAQSNLHAVLLPFNVTHEPNFAFDTPPEEFAMFGISDQFTQRPTSIAPYIMKTTVPLPKLIEAGADIAGIDNTPSSDGVYRRIALVHAFGSFTLPSLGLAAFQRMKIAGAENELVAINGEGLNRYNLRVKLKEESRPWNLEFNARGEARLRFYGSPLNYQSLTVQELLAKKIDREKLESLLKDKLVFVGSVALGAHDLRHSPIDSNLPGVYYHANAYSALRDRAAFEAYDSSIFASFLVLIGSCLLLFIAMQVSQPLLHAGVLAALIAGIAYADSAFFLPNGFTLALGFLSFSLAATYAWMTMFDFIQTIRERQKIRGAFTRYVAPDIVKEMLAHPEMLRVGGMKKNVSIIFSDIRDFTSISEKLSPQDLATLLNRYMGRMTDILFDSKGTLDKYIGDAIVGFWGAPIEIENHPLQAVKGSLEMVEALPEINNAFRQEGFPQISIGIGINTGDVSVGNMGSDRIFAYTALGDHMNLASRLEGLTKTYGVNLLISEFTHTALGTHKEQFRMRTIDNVRVKGRLKPVRIYEVLQRAHPLLASQTALVRYEEAFSLYQSRKFSEASQIFDSLMSEFAVDKAIQIHAKSSAHFAASPPGPDWDGVTTFTTK